MLPSNYYAGRKSLRRISDLLLKDLLVQPTVRLGSLQRSGKSLVDQLCRICLCRNGRCPHERRIRSILHSLYNSSRCFHFCKWPTTIGLFVHALKMMSTTLLHVMALYSSPGRTAIIYIQLPQLLVTFI